MIFSTCGHHVCEGGVTGCSLTQGMLGITRLHRVLEVRDAHVWYTVLCSPVERQWLSSA